LYSTDGWVFIGKAENLQQALFKCLDKKRQYFWPDEPDAFIFELGASDQLDDRHGELILEFYPRRNHLPDKSPARIEKAS
jgi:hypothetical protein